MGQEHQLDVRPLTLPQRFSAIFAKLDELGAGDSLLLFNDFEPLPLFSELERRGYTYESRQTGETEWHIKIDKP
ncbi:MAG TPA: DUF2249 domain-containing protein [Dehalococcoidia bacterium]|nr:DUF2249 domain-containing protein [Dehalococcoidia bacterium]